MAKVMSVLVEVEACFIRLRVPPPTRISLRICRQQGAYGEGWTSGGEVGRAWEPP